MNKLKLWLEGRVLLLSAKLEGLSSDDIDSGLMLFTVNELEQLGINITVESEGKDK